MKNLYYFLKFFMKFGSAWHLVRPIVSIYFLTWSLLKWLNTQTIVDFSIDSELSINNYRLENISESAPIFEDYLCGETEERKCFYIAMFQLELRCINKDARFLSLFILSVKKDVTDSDQPWASALDYPQEKPASLCELCRAPI